MIAPMLAITPAEFEIDAVTLFVIVFLASAAPIEIDTPTAPKAPANDTASVVGYD